MHQIVHNEQRKSPNRLAFGSRHKNCIFWVFFQLVEELPGVVQGQHLPIVHIWLGIEIEYLWKIVFVGFSDLEIHFFLAKMGKLCFCLSGDLFRGYLAQFSKFVISNLYLEQNILSLTWLYPVLALFKVKGSDTSVSGPDFSRELDR